MKLTLQKLQAQNFKGHKDIQLQFTDLTQIVGDNGTGKTSLVDAFMWLLFGKDSQDRKDFNVKPLDSNNEPLHRLEYMVDGWIDADGTITHLKRTLIEKWQKKRGATEAEFTGHETLFFVNDVPYQAGDYAKYIASIIPEEMFKLVTSPSYFNSMDWKKRREVLISMAGEVGTDVPLSLMPLLNGKTLDQLRSEIAAKKKNLKTQLDQIPSRVDEVSKGKPDGEDWDLLQETIREETNGIAGIDTQIADRTKGQDAQLKDIAKVQASKQELQNKLASLKNTLFSDTAAQKEQLTQQIEAATRYITSAKQGIENNNKTIAERQGIIVDLEKERTALGEKWKLANSEQAPAINSGDIICPTCRQDLPEDLAAQRAETLLSEFNTAKALKVKAIVNDGNAKKTEIERHKETVAKLEADNVELERVVKIKEDDVIRFKYDLDCVPKATAPTDAETALQAQIDAIVTPTIQPIDISDLQAQRKAASDTITDCKLRLAKREQITAANERISQLLADEKNYAQQLADLEKTEFAIDEFNRLKIEEVERKINGLFSIVKFKMFATQINGGEVETCETLVNGVPYSDLNTAMQINAGLDIINALSKYYGISAPIWIDKKESVTLLIPTDAQVITLSVFEGSKLRVL